MKLTATFVLVSALALVGCGGNETTTPEATEKPKVTKPSKFKGAKFAPPQEQMNYLAGQSFAMMFGRKTLAIGDCSGFDLKNYEQPCRAGVDAIAQSSVFKAEECTKGDAWNGQMGDKHNAVSCLGVVETSLGSIKGTFVFHKPGNEWMNGGLAEKFRETLSMK